MSAPPRDKERIELLSGWKSLNLDLGRLAPVAKLSDNTIEYKEAIFLQKPSASPYSEVDIINASSREFSDYGPLPGFIRRMSDRSNNVVELLHLLSNVSNINFDYRENVIYATVSHFLYPDIEPEIRNENTNCYCCKKELEPVNQIKVASCMHDHLFCSTCFQNEFSSDKDSPTFALCPGDGCKASASRRDMEYGGIPASVVYSIAKERVSKYLLATVKSWRPCFLESCCGGSGELIDNSYYVCILCGAFNALDGVGVVQIHQDPVVQDALTWCYKRAVNESRHMEHYFPFDHCAIMFSDKRGNPDLSRLKDKANLIPDIASGKEITVRNDQAVFSLIKFIIETNLTRMRHLDNTNLPKKIIETLKFDGISYANSEISKCASFQVQSVQKDEIDFQMEKRKHGSFYAWHGSAVGNWHSILKNGLKSMSGTTYQANGAAYGNGIYCSPHYNTAVGYSRKSPDNAFAVSMIEVVDHPSLKKNNQIYVVPQEKHCQIRFFFTNMIKSKTDNARGWW